MRYAESDDGMTWKMPRLGLIERRGSLQNNIVFGAMMTKGVDYHGGSVFKDPAAPGGMCNTDTLISGFVRRIEAEAREIIDLGRDGGGVIGTHSISPEVPIEHFAAYRKVCETCGRVEPAA